MSKKTTDQDAELFRNSIGQVKPIKNSNQIQPDKSRPKPYPQKNQQAKNSHFNAASGHEIDRLAQEDSVSFLAAGLQKNVIKKLRKGHFGLDASIDLHGLTSKEANQYLYRFIEDSLEKGYRSVHIIHGKGYRSDDNQPVLKNDINHWLRQHKQVQAFCSAAPRDGGTGAVMVLLKLSEKYSDEEST